MLDSFGNWYFQNLIEFKSHGKIIEYLTDSTNTPEKNRQTLKIGHRVGKFSGYFE
jgi:hypothetical protein